MHRPSAMRSAGSQEKNRICNVPMEKCLSTLRADSRTCSPVPIRELQTRRTTMNLALYLSARRCLGAIRYARCASRRPQPVRVGKRASLRLSRRRAHCEGRGSGPVDSRWTRQYGKGGTDHHSLTSDVAPVTWIFYSERAKARRPSI